MEQILIKYLTYKYKTKNVHYHSKNLQKMSFFSTKL